MLMFMGLMSSLYALDTIKIGCDVEKSQTLDVIDDATSIPASKETVKVNILHKDTLMYSWGNEHNSIQLYFDNHKIDIRYANLIKRHEKIGELLTKEWKPTLEPIAVVCHLHGVYGR